MGKCFEGNSLNVPEGSKIPGIDVELPYFLVGDEIFPLKTWLMRPYPSTLDETQRIYNYRVSRARRTIENVFGILAERWRIFRKAIRADIKTVEAIVQECVCLHNFLQLTVKSPYSSQGFIDSEMEDGSICPGDWRHLVPNVQSGLCCLPKAKGGRQQTNAKDTQRALKDYLNTTEGSVEWQWEYINRLGSVLRTEQMTKYFNKHCVFNKTKSVFYILKNKAASIQI